MTHLYTTDGFLLGGGRFGTVVAGLQIAFVVRECGSGMPGRQPKVVDCFLSSNMRRIDPYSHSSLNTDHTRSSSLTTIPIQTDAS